MSDLDIVKTVSALKIRHLIGQGKIDPQTKNEKGQDLLLQSLEGNIESNKIRAILSSAKRVKKMPDVKSSLQALEQESIRVFSVCYHNLSALKIDSDKKELVQQLLGCVDENTCKEFVVLNQFLNRAIVQEVSLNSLPHLIQPSQTPKVKNNGICRGGNDAWALA